MRKFQGLRYGFVLSAVVLCAGAPAATAASLSPAQTDYESFAHLGKTSKGTLLAGINWGSIYRSTDGGKHWDPSLLAHSYPVHAFLMAGDSLILASRPAPYNGLADCFTPECFNSNSRISSDVVGSRDDGKTW